MAEMLSRHNWEPKKDLIEQQHAGTIYRLYEERGQRLDDYRKELAIRDAVADEALAILRKVTGKTDYHNIAEAAYECAQLFAAAREDSGRLDRLEALLGIKISYNPELVAAPGPKLRSEIDLFLAQLDAAG